MKSQVGFVTGMSIAEAKRMTMTEIKKIQDRGGTPIAIVLDL